MTTKLTDRYCATAKPKPGAVQTDHFDEQVRGLALRVSRSGRKTWTYHCVWGRKRHRLTIGTYPATSLGAARTRAIEARGRAEAGTDPRSGTGTVGAVIDEFLAAYVRPRLRTADHVTRAFERLVKPHIGALPIDEVRRSDIARMLDAIASENGPVMADRVLAHCSKAFNWHASRSDDFRSPIVRGMARTKPRERARERTLTDDELRSIWAVPGLFPAFVRFLLLTATRRNEAAHVRRSEIVSGDWTIPAARYKTKVDHVVPLSQAALAVIEGIGTHTPSPNLAGPSYSGTDFIFTTTNGRPISAFDKFKLKLDKASGTSGWTLHDLRRTARSLMSRVGVAPDVAERCLGHAMPGVRGTYDRHAYHAEKAQAFEALASQVERIVNPQANVVAIGERR